MHTLYEGAQIIGTGKPSAVGRGDFPPSVAQFAQPQGGLTLRGPVGQLVAENPFDPLQPIPQRIAMQVQGFRGGGRSASAPPEVGRSVCRNSAISGGVLGELAQLVVHEPLGPFGVLAEQGGQALVAILVGPHALAAQQPDPQGIGGLQMRTPEAGDA